MSQSQPQTPYQLLGGDAAIRRLVDHFYDLMEALPETAQIRAMHPTDLGGSRDKLYMFLSGWFGGPNLYVEEYGHPRLRARHLPFAIDESARDQWLLCMNRALDAFELDAMMMASLKQSFFNMANHMRNEREHGLA